jgi:endonuclease/exonuclease/phosphatase family metal-dependent hydrolase
MNRSVVVILAAIAAAGSWYFFNQIPVDPQGNGPFPTGTSSPVPTPTAQPNVRPGLGQTIRIATFNLGMYGPAKMSDAAAMEILARTIRNFDIVAVQEIRTRDQGATATLVDQVNSIGRQYDYVLSDRLGRTSQKEQFAFIFDTRTVTVDRNQLYTLYDPDDLVHREPFVAMFRALGPSIDQAFTFTLVNLHTDPDLIDRENVLLPQIIQEVRNDGRHEDDIIVLGDFNDSASKLTKLMMAPADLMWALPNDTPTNTRGDAQYDNILFSRQFTDEFTGRGGVFDFLREFNLTSEQALRVSDHMPVWAEFRVFEGNAPGRFAEQEPVLRR